MVEREVFEDGVFWAQKAGKSVLPQRNLVERLGHLCEAIDHQIDLASLNIEKAHVRGVHDVERDTRRLLAQFLEHVGK